MIKFKLKIHCYIFIIQGPNYALLGAAGLGIFTAQCKEEEEKSGEESGGESEGEQGAEELEVSFHYAYIIITYYVVVVFFCHHVESDSLAKLYYYNSKLSHLSLGPKKEEEAKEGFP